jgi:uncharacterized membrane protein YgcG
MGQQQLLLLVLTTVIVGLAIVGGLEAFDQSQRRANQDALAQLAVEIATDVQATAQKPVAMGGKGVSDVGQSTSADPTVTLSLIGYTALPASESDFFDTEAVDGETYANINGECALTDANVETSPVTVECRSGMSEVVVEITEFSPDGIAVVSQTSSGGSGTGGGGGDSGDDGGGDGGGGGGGGGGFGGGYF